MSGYLLSQGDLQGVPEDAFLVALLPLTPTTPSIYDLLRTFA